MKGMKTKVVFKVIFGRTIVILVLLIVQLMMLFSTYLMFYDIMEYIIGGFTLLSAIIVITIVNNKSNPAFKLAWILPVLVFPVFGGFLYLIVERNIGGRKFYERVSYILDETAGLLHTKDVTKELIQKKNLKTLATYVEKTSNFPIYQNTNIEYFSLGEHKFEALLKQLKLAKKFIFLEYFIIEKGKMWDAILEILVEKSKQGVEVRVMYDGMGTILTLPANYDQELREKGIKAKVFSPVIPLVSTHQNNRDHRKIAVIDGVIAFNGGVNLADEYINHKVVYGHWKDVAIMLKGEAVQSFTLMFLQLWNIDEKKLDDYRPYLQTEVNELCHGFVMPYCDNPLTHNRVGEVVYMDIINKAKNYIYIMTPYLIIDNEMLTALTVSAKSGVDVVIIMPHIADKQMPFDIARTFYPVLLEAGVQIYEYTQGFIHAKMFVSDSKKAVVGTVNMDYRSLYHHFECATYMQEIQEITQMEKDFLETMKKCHKISINTYRELPLIRRISGRVFRLVAPLV